MKHLRIGAIAAGGVLGVALLATTWVRAGDGARRIEIVRAFGGSHLGVHLDDAQGAERGAIVKEVVKDSPAEKAGLKDGDVIVRFDGEAVRSASQLVRLVSETPSGRTVPIEVRRAGATQKLEATLSDEGKGGLLRHFGFDEVEPPEPPRPPKAPRAPRPPRFDFRWDEDGLPGEFFCRGGPRKLGIEYQRIEGQLAKYFKTPGDSGVLITSVDEGGPAAKAGMKAGDVILKLNGESIEGRGDLRAALDGAEPGAEVTIQVLREGRSLDLKVTLGGQPEKSRSSEST